MKCSWVSWRERERKGRQKTVRKADKKSPDTIEQLQHSNEK